MKSTVSSSQAAPPIGPYPQAVRANGLLFLSGQLPLDPETGAIVEGGIAEQTKRALQNIEALLQAAGSDMSKVVRCVVFLKNMADFGAMNAAYAEHFGATLPVRTTIEAARLPRESLIEIEATALE